MKDIEARKLASQFGSRMCDENGDTHGEELYCFSLDDIIAIKEVLAQPAQEPDELTIAYMSGLYDGKKKRSWVEPTVGEWWDWWRVSPAADETEAEINFADFLNIAQAVVAYLKEKNT